MLIPRVMENLYLELLQQIGEDPDRHGLQKTPERAARAFRFLTEGYQADLNEIVNGAIFPTERDDLVAIHNIELYSLCEHHLLPFFGVCHVGYIPNGRILGVSKIPRIINALARRLQVQEHLTSDIADAILECTGAKGVAVVIEARHLCMMMRGVEKQNSSMKTSSLRGVFHNEPATRAEFFNLIADRR